MSTGYTAFIEDGTITNAEDFIMLCARAFGACVTMRDEPLSKPIPEKFEEDRYYREAFKREQKRLVDLISMTKEQIKALNEAEYRKHMREKEEAIKRNKELKAKYLAILDNVRKWNPPTEEHENLKKFCIEQIEICLPDYSYYERECEKESDEEWIKMRIEACKEDMERYERKAKEEHERTESRNKWLSDLRRSLGLEVSSGGT